MCCFVILLLSNEMQMSVRRFSAIPHLRVDVSHSSQPSSETTRKVFIYTSYQNNVTMDDPVSS